MCGIAGFAGFSENGLIRRMCNSIMHRGPDDEGILECEESRISIGMRRLSIIDLSGGHQPISSSDKKLDIVFNGEIYNFRNLRDELKANGYQFSTNSDTEVVLASYIAWGMDAFSKLHGMFAFAIIDRRGRIPVLTVARDRTGIKPLYYIFQGGKFCFSSELKALMCWADWDRDVRLQGIRDYLSLRYVPGEDSLFQAVKKLSPGTCLTYEQGRLEAHQWWQPPVSSDSALQSDEPIVEKVEKALDEAVRRHLVSDVPVGAFLSGGIDSGLIVALMQKNGAGPINSFCIGYPDGGDADTQGARKVADALGTNHSSIECRQTDIAMLPDMVWALDEPIGDPIIIPMYVLAREARRQVKVVLSGEGADEIFGGYEFHRRLVQLIRLRSFLPEPFWKMASLTCQIVPARILDLVFNYPGRLGDEGRRKISQLLRSVGNNDLGSLYRESISLFDRRQLDDLVVHNGLRRFCEMQPGYDLDAIMKGGKTPLEKLVLAQFRDWLSDDILMKADKMSMAHGLEARVPFMDASVISAAAGTPDSYKLSPHGNKWVLRELGRKYLPPEIINAKKRPFYFPMEKFTQTQPFENLMRFCLDDKRTKKRGLFNSDYIKSLKSPSPKHGFLAYKRLFSIVMLELWFDRFAPDASWA